MFMNKVMKDNVLVLRRYMLKYLGMNYHKVCN